jgi:hypothetical protein
MVKSRLLILRISDEQEALLLEKAKLSGLNISEYVRTKLFMKV